MRAFSRTLLLLTSTAALIIGSPVNQSGKITQLCGNPEPTEEQQQVAKDFLQQERLLRTGSAPVKRQTISVDTYFHILADAETVEGGYLTTESLDAQLQKINDAYGPHGFTFNLVDTDYTINSRWAVGSDGTAMKRALRKGSYSDLNVYFHKSLPNGLGGQCPFPRAATPGSSAFINDGCIVLGGSVPGGLLGEPYHLGGILVHEIGHWMNLFHTFQGGCTGGDSVDDTPAQSTLTRGCAPKEGLPWPDTCPNLPGLDPIQNFMDYSGDTCWEEFTAGQEERMHSAWRAYRQ
ncbi:Extracellular metalloprotease [Paramyrothecium foliicola]|nr:Extracellular metalloprotease [Paramyrothecium foliicola]